MVSDCDEAPRVEGGAGAPADPAFDQSRTVADPAVGAARRGVPPSVSATEGPPSSDAERVDGVDVVDAVAALVDDLVDGPDADPGDDPGDEAGGHPT